MGEAMPKFNPEENMNNLPDSSAVVNKDETVNEMERREDICTEHSERMKEMVQKFFSASDSEREEIMRGISLRANLVKEDLQLVEDEPIDEAIDGKEKEKLQNVLDIAEAFREYISSGEGNIVNYGRKLSIELTNRKNAGDKTEEIENKAKRAVRFMEMFPGKEEIEKTTKLLKNDIGLESGK